MTIRESLNILDTKAIDGEGKFLDLRNLYEAAKLDYDKKKKLKELIDRNEDAEVIAAYLESDGKDLSEDLDDVSNKGFQVLILGKLFDADPSRWQQAVEDWGYDITPYATADEFLENVDTLELLNRFAELVKNNDYLNSSWYELFDFTDYDSNSIEENLNEGIISFKESFDPKSYNQALDDYMSSKNISVEKLFGALNYDDPRYKQLFNSLKDLGYKPRETGTYSRGYFVPAMTITVSTRKVPDDVIDLIHKLAGVTGRHIGFHKGANNWKLKFELRDDDFSSFRDKLLQSLNEQDEIEENLKESVSDINDWILMYLKHHPFDSADEMIEYVSEYEDIDALEDRFRTDVIGAIEDYFEDNLNESLNESVISFKDFLTGIEEATTEDEMLNILERFDTIPANYKISKEQYRTFMKAWRDKIKQIRQSGM